jgi:hypothetical protein
MHTKRHESIPRSRRREEAGGIGNYLNKPPSPISAMPKPRGLYREPKSASRSEIEKALELDDVDFLLSAVIGVSMDCDDWLFAQSLCVRLAAHKHFTVRGNAVLGFGHIARVHRKLDRDLVQPIINIALSDPSDYVRGQAVCAVDDTVFYLHWHFPEYAGPTNENL